MTHNVKHLNDFYLELAEGNFEEYSVVHKFGRNESIGTTFEPISIGGIYRTPQVAGSHAAAIVIENAAGTQDWATIGVTNFPKGQTEIGAYTVPLGYQAWIKNIFLHAETAKPVELLLFQRRNILQTAAPYSAMREVYNSLGIVDSVPIPRDIPLGPFPELTDIGFIGRVTSTAASASVNFDIILEKE